jgi:hypothetical protein
MVHLGSSRPRVGLTWASQQPRKMGIWHAAASAADAEDLAGLGKRRDKQPPASMVDSKLDPLACSGLGGDLPAARGAGPKAGTST